MSAIGTLLLFSLALSGWVCAGTLETARWQAAIDAAAAKGGGRVVVGPGVHPVGTLWLRSNVEQRLPDGKPLIHRDPTATIGSFIRR